MTIDRPAPLVLRPEGETDIVIDRRFHAPRPLVWRAFTEADLIPRWLWGKDSPMTVCDQDFRPGGAFRWGWTLPDGSLMALNGKFLEIEAPARLVHTELFEEDWTGGETVVTTRFAEDGAHTRVTMTIVYSSEAARDAVMRTPMAEGMEEGYERLDGLLPEWA